MARIPMVTRTIKSTKAVCMTVNVEVGETETTVYELPRTFPDKATLLKQCKKQFETETHKVVAILDVQESEQLYGMTEADFIKYADVLPPRTEKVEEQ